MKATDKTTSHMDGETVEIEGKNKKNTFNPYAPHPLKWWHLPLALLLIAGTIYIIYSNNKKDTAGFQHAEGNIFGTTFHISYKHDKDLKHDILQRLHQVDQSLSPFNKTSIITLINENKDAKTNEMFDEVFTMAQSVSHETNGAFDITVAPLVNAWGFGFKNASNITDSLIDSLRRHVGYTKVSLRNGQVIKTHPSVMLDCSAIAKGYGVDQVALLLESHGISDYMVEIGGEIRVNGRNKKGEDWRIGINKPVDDSTSVNNEIEQIVSITNMAMATSGNYRNFYVKGDKKYAHTIDPRIGRPVQHNLLSATVFAQDCALADAYATSFMVLGKDSAVALLNHHPELMAYLIYVDGSMHHDIWYSPQLEKHLR